MYDIYRYEEDPDNKRTNATVTGSRYKCYNVSDCSSTLPQPNHLAVNDPSSLAVKILVVKQIL